MKSRLGVFIGFKKKYFLSNSSQLKELLSRVLLSNLHFKPNATIQSIFLPLKHTFSSGLDFHLFFPFQ